jgi:hypothetical protein
VQGLSGPLVIFDRCPFAPKASGPHIHCTWTESILAIYEAEFRLDPIVGFVAKDVITNHGALLKVHDEHLKIRMLFLAHEPGPVSQKATQMTNFSTEKRVFKS